MVRVISSGFSTPRSRHSSGEEMIDRFAAMKALCAFSDDDKHDKQSKDDFTPKTLVIDCNTDTNDSFSGQDSEDDLGASMRKDVENNNEPQNYQDPSSKKKERRRERNKVSAQNYRQRRRQQVSAAQRTLDSLESHNKNLLEKVRQLEAEKHIVEEYLRSCVRVPWCPYHRPSSPPCCKNPPIPEEPIEHHPQHHHGDQHGDHHGDPGLAGPIIGATSSTASAIPDNMIAVCNDNINNNSMPLCMSGVDMSTNGSSIS